MVYEIVWTKKAVESYNAVITYLEKEWTPKEIQKLAGALEQKLAILLHHPYLGASASKKNRAIRSTALHKRLSLIYRVRPNLNRIELLLFWNTYQDPQRLNKAIHTHK